MSDSTMILRAVLGRRFNIHRHLIRPDDIKTLMSYMSMADLKNLTEDEMDAVLKTGRANGTFRGLTSK